LEERICCTPDSRRSAIIVGDSMEIMALSTSGKFYWFNLINASYSNYYDIFLYRNILKNLNLNVDLNEINIKKTPFIINSKNNIQLASYIDLENSNWLIKLDNSPYYMCSKDASKLLHYVTPNLKVIGFEQLDPVYNRPDIVLDSIGRYFGGADQELVLNYRQTQEKRIYRLGLNKELLGKEIAVPSAEIIDADRIKYENNKGKLKIKVAANDSKYPLRKFNIYINEVPYYGSTGISIAQLKTQEWDTTLTIPLNVGRNKIQVSIMNELGLENFKYSTYVNYTPKEEVKSKIYYIGIGVNQFKFTGHDLKYCVKDVTDLANWFAGPNTEIKLYSNTQVVKENILDLKKYLKNTNVNDKVIISCSSHGLLDDNMNFYLAMHDIDFKNPKARGLSYEELESLLDSIPARQKLLLLDACNSGENDKAELLKKDLQQNQSTMDSTQIISLRGAIMQVKEANVNIFKKMNELFVNVRNNTGSVIISAAGGQESALEGIKVDGKKIKNGAFTYSILECLKHYKGKDLKVNTLKQYTEKRVEEITESKQKPTSRQETMEIDWILNDFMTSPKTRAN
ncbi:MAG: caspase domain-containing protein, partial [Bacteroidota bacterium]